MFTREPITKEEKKKMIGKVIEEAIKVTFSNHTYTYRNEFYKQIKGGAIGLRLTGVVARLVMDKWATLFRKHLKEAGVSEYLIEKYVDDVNVVTGILDIGWSWIKVTYKKEEILQ